MSKGDVTLQFSAADAGFVQYLMKAREELLKTSDHARKLGDSFEHAGDSGEHAMMHLASHLGMVVSAAGTVTAAVETVFKTFENRTRELEDRAEKFIARTQSLNEAVAASGQLGALGAIQSGVKGLAAKEIGGRRFSETDAGAMVVAIVSATGAKIDQGQFAVPAGEVGLSAQAAGMSPGAASMVGVHFARLEQMRAQGQYAGTDEELRNAAFTAAVYHPNMNDKDWRFVARSPDKQKAMRLLAAAGQSDENSRTLMELETLSRGSPSRLDALLAHPPHKLEGAVGNLVSGMSRSPTLSLAAAIEAYRASGRATESLTDHQQTTSFSQRTGEAEGPSAADEQEIRDKRKTIFAREHPGWNDVPFVTRFMGLIPRTEEHSALNFDPRFKPGLPQERIDQIYREDSLAVLKEISAKLDMHSATLNNTTDLNPHGRDEGHR